MNAWSTRFAALLAALALAGCGGDGPGGPDGNGGNGGGDGPIDTTASASGCLNPALLASGGRFEVTLREFEGNQRTTTQSVSFQVTGNTLFNGEIWTSLIGTSVMTAGTSTLESYLRAEEDTLVQGGSFASTPVPGQGAMRDEETQVLVPPVVQRFDLEAGESFEQSYVETFVAGDTVVGDPLEESVIDMRQTFVGVQEISVPAGRFRACRFDSNITKVTDGTSSEITSQVWIGEDNGLILRTRQSRNNVRSGSDLVSASINGLPVE